LGKKSLCQARSAGDLFYDEEFLGYHIDILAEKGYNSYNGWRLFAPLFEGIWSCADLPVRNKGGCPAAALHTRGIYYV